MKLFLIALIPYFLIAATQSCEICHMSMTPKAPTSYMATQKGKAVPLCSYSCAHRFHKKYPHEPLKCFGYGAGKELDTAQAYFAFKSPTLDRAYNDTMLPVVVAFESECMAKKVAPDGKIVQGFEKIEAQ